MPRRRKARSISFELDSSSAGSRCGSISTIVTSAPNERQTLANSTPITPPPRMTTDAGHPVQAQRVLAGDDPLAVHLQAGQAAGLRAGGQHDVRALDDGSPTRTWVGEMSWPEPSITSMWRLATRPVRPFHSRVTTLSL